VKLPLGKLHSLEVATSENTRGNLPLGKYPWEVAVWGNDFGKVPNIYKYIL